MAFDSRQVARNALVIAALVIGAKLFAALREMVIAWRYGVSPLVDAFQIAFTVVTWAPMLLTSIMITVLVPQLVASRKDVRHRQFVSELNAAVLLLGLGTLVATLLLGPWIVGLIARDLGGDAVAMSRNMVYWLVPFAPLLILCGYLGLRLQAVQRFGYTFLEAMPALLLCLLVVAASSGAEYWPLMVGLLAGGALQLLLLVLIVMRRDERLGSLNATFGSERWVALRAGFGMIALGQTFNALTIPVDQIVAAGLGTGAVATIGYSNRLIGLVTGLCITVIGYAMLPVLSGNAARGEFAAGRSRTLRFAAILFLLGMVATAVGELAARFGVRLVFQRGAFTADDTALVVSIFRISLLQIPFFASAIALLQWLAATGRHGSICLVLLLIAGSKLAAALLLSDVFGLAGLAMSQVVMSMVFFLGMLVFALRPHHTRPGKTQAIEIVLDS